MINEKHYVPIVKWKRGEQKALKELSNAVFENMTPVIELLLPNNNVKTGEPSKTIEEHTENISKDLETVFQNQKLFFIDCKNLKDKIGESYANLVYDKIQEKTLNYIPVIYLQSSEEEINLVKNNKNGICVRVDTDTLSSLDFPQNLLKFLSQINVKTHNVDLILDLAAVIDIPQSILEKTCLEAVNVVAEKIKVRTLILSMTSMPEDMSKIKANTAKSVPRKEWLLWKNLHKKFQRIPTFSDYGIQYPQLVAKDPRIIKPSANIRYTIEDAFLFFKGKSFRDHGGEQFRTLAKALIKSGYYYGEKHCIGCNKIFDIANHKEKTGSLETWRTIGSIHHFTVTTNQIQNNF